MTKGIGLFKSLGFSGDRAFQEGLVQCALELFGVTRDQLKAHWRPKESTDTGTLRGYMQPTAEALFTQWKACRDPAWLYSHPDYKWDSLGVSVCQTAATTMGGIKLLRDSGLSPGLAFDWGAGPGFSTLMLARNFPDAEVHYNECNAELVSIFEWFRAHSGLTNVRHVYDPQGPYDLVQAYEIAEHIVHSSRPGVGDPVTETARILMGTTPSAAFLHSSCWSAENRYFTLGHFLVSDVDGELHKNTRVGAPFRKAMNRRGWVEAGAGWNSRPYLFLKRPIVGVSALS